MTVVREDIANLTTNANNTHGSYKSHPRGCPPTSSSSLFGDYGFTEERPSRKTSPKPHTPTYAKLTTLNAEYLQLISSKEEMCSTLADEDLTQPDNPLQVIVTTPTRCSSSDLTT
jgi:hypothetical protein